MGSQLSLFSLLEEYFMRNISYAAPCLRPSFIPKPKRLRGSRGAGLAYERALAKAVKSLNVAEILHGQWFHYKDQFGPGWCQPDIVFLSAKFAVVIEVKLTNVQEARKQLQELYLPVLSVAYPEKEVVGVIALRHVSSVEKEVEIFDCIFDAIEESRQIKSKMPPAKDFGIFHWLGNGPITYRPMQLGLRKNPWFDVAFCGRMLK